jgi:WD40 repeat protein
VHAIDSPGHVFDVAVTPDGSRVAAIVEAPPWDPAPEAEPMGWAVVWSFEDGEELYRVDADGDGFGRPGGLAFGPDGLLAIGGGDGNVRFADADTGELRGRPVRASAGWVLSIDFAPDGRTLVTGATDGTVRLFDVDGRFQIGTSLPGVDNFWARALFAPGAERVLSLHDDGREFRWDVSPAAWSQRACEVAGRALTEEEWERFLPGRAYDPACAS